MTANGSSSLCPEHKGVDHPNRMIAPNKSSSAGAVASINSCLRSFGVRYVLQGSAQRDQSGDRRVRMAVQMAGLSAIKTLAGFDFAFQPSLDRNRVLALAGLQFIDRAEALHLIGPPGTGDVGPPDPKQRRNHKGTTGVGAPTRLVKRISLGGLRVDVCRRSRNGFQSHQDPS